MHMRANSTQLHRVLYWLVIEAEYEIASSGITRLFVVAVLCIGQQAAHAEPDVGCAIWHQLGIDAIDWELMARSLN